MHLFFGRDDKWMAAIRTAGQAIVPHTKEVWDFSCHVGVRLAYVFGSGLALQFTDYMRTAKLLGPNMRFTPSVAAFVIMTVRH
jgi:hypothetical protein